MSANSFNVCTVFKRIVASVLSVSLVAVSTTSCTKSKLSDRHRWSRVMGDNDRNGSMTASVYEAAAPVTNVDFDSGSTVTGGITPEGKPDGNCIGAGCDDGDNKGSGSGQGSHSAPLGTDPATGAILSDPGSWGIGTPANWDPTLTDSGLLDAGTIVPDSAPAAPGSSPVGTGATVAPKDGANGTARTFTQSELLKIRDEAKARALQAQANLENSKKKQAQLQETHEKLVARIEAEAAKAAAELDVASSEADAVGSTFDFEPDALVNRHNEDAREFFASLPKDLVLLQPSPEAKGPRSNEDSTWRTPHEAPLGERLRAERAVFDVLQSDVSAADKPAFAAAEGLLASADLYAAEGDSRRAQSRLEAARGLALQASAGSLPKFGPDENEPTRRMQGEMGRAAVGLYESAAQLDEEGLPSVADDVLFTAGELLEAAVNVARMAQLADIPMTAAEAFTGKTLDFSDSGEPFLRDTTTIERGFAIASLGLAAAGGLVGGPVGIAAAGMIGRIGKSVIKREAKQAAAEAAEKALAKGLSKAEREAAEHAAREAAEKKAAAAAKAAEDNAARANMPSINNPKTRTHVLDGNFAPDGKLKGGMHTGQATDDFIGRLPPNVRAQVTRETLPNGVERTVFPVDALTPGALEATKGAADKGRGVLGGKTSFPRGWTKDTIDEAIEHVAKNGQLISENTKRGTTVFAGDWKGVRVEINIGPKKGGGTQVNSAYPSWLQ